MALTKVTGQVVNTSTDLTVGVLTATTVAIGGTLTYEDVTNVDSVGLITARNGIEVTDKGVQVGTGATVDSAAANTLTFLTNGSERLRVDSAGRVGIGTDSPARELVVHNDSADAHISIRSVDSQQAMILFGDNASDSIGQIRYDNTDNSLAFRVNTDERLRIDSSGRLLVGTSSARTKFQISTGFGNVTPIHQLEFSSQTYNGLSITHNAGANVYPAVLAFGKSRGTSAGSYTAVSSGDGLGWLDFSGADGTNMVRAASIKAEVDGTPGSNDMPGRLTFSTTADGESNTTERMRIDSSGDVQARRARSNTAGDVALSIQPSDSTIHYGLRIDSTNNSLNLDRASGTAANLLTIDSSGRLLIGPTSARGVGHSTAGTFEIEATSGTVFASVLRNSADAYGPSIALGKSRGTSVGDNTVLQSGDEIGSIRFAGADGTDVQTRAAQITAAVDGTPGSNDMPGRLVFSTTADGANSPTERMRIDSTGRLLIGTSSVVNDSASNNIQSVHTGGSSLLLGRNDSSVTNGNLIGAVRFFANDPSGYNEVAKIVCDAAGAHASDDYPTRLEFHTTSDGASTPTERLRIHEAGHGEFNSGAITRVLVADDVSLSGTSQTVTGIPSWATKITVILYRASLSGSADFIVQLRADGSNITSNYVSGSANDTGTINDTSTAGFIISNTNSSHKTSGRMVIERVGTDTKWVSSHQMVIDTGTPRHGAGDLSSYSGTIDGVRILDTGSNSFDNGTITVIAEA